MAENPKKIRLTYITTLPVTQWKFLKGQNAYMAERGFELHAIASPTGYVDLSQVRGRDGVITHAVPISRDISPVGDIVSLVRLLWTLRQIQPHIVHLSTPKAALLGSIAAWLARVPIRIFLIRGLLSEGTSGFRRHLFRSLERVTAKLCHQHICNSRSLLTYAREEGILEADQGIVLANGMSNGIDTEYFNPHSAPLDSAVLENIGPSFGEGTFIIGYVGRLCHDKGIAELTQAWVALREEYPNIRLLLVGDFESTRGVEEKWRMLLERDPRVHITGFVEDVVPYYRAMSLFVFPSHREGFPNAPMEAAAMQLPVIATYVTGCRDAVQDGVTGTLVPPHDATSLVRAISTYVDDPALCQKHGKAGRARILNDFRQETIWAAIYQEYMRLLTSHHIVAPHQVLDQSG
jgi:glycosyltransferase involved in cell wall biosynthesis